MAHHSLSVPAAQWEALPFSFYTGRVLAVALDGSVETIAKVPGQPSGIRFLPDGGMLIVSMRDRRILRRELDATLVKHADLSGLAPWQLNDMLVDHHGRACVGNLGFDLMGGANVTSTNLICVDPDGDATVAVRSYVRKPIVNGGLTRDTVRKEGS